MNTLPLVLAALLLSISGIKASSFHMLAVGQTLQTNTTDFVEVTACGTGEIQIKVPSVSSPYSWSGIVSGAPSANGTPAPLAAVGRVGSLITGVEWVKGYTTWCVVKVTPANENVPATPSNVAVIPEDATGQFDVILESSVDMLTWTPANPGIYGGNTASRFFRTRIVRT